MKKITNWFDTLEKRTKELQENEKKYYELLWAVESKYIGESRHETALRYIRQAENRCDDEAKQEMDKCPECKQQTVTTKLSGVECTDPDCDYWFCY